MRFSKNKKAYMAPMLTLGYALFSILTFVMIACFASDPLSGEDIGDANDNSVLTGVNESQTSDSISWTDLGWTERFWVTLSNMPWWLNVFLVSFQVVMFTVVVLCWVRGL